MAGQDDQNSTTPVEGYEDGSEPLTFHYRQGSFRQYEQKSMSDLATGQNQPKRGIFRVLVGTKTNRFIFIILVICVGLVLAVTYLTGKPNEGTAGNLYLELNAFSYSEKIYSSLKMNIAGTGKMKNPNRDYTPRKVHAVFIYYDTEGNELYRSGEEGTYPEEDTGNRQPEEPKEGFLRNSYTDYGVATVECVVTVGEDSESALFDGCTTSLKATVTQQ